MIADFRSVYSAQSLSQPQLQLQGQCIRNDILVRKDGVNLKEVKNVVTITALASIPVSRLLADTDNNNCGNGENIICIGDNRGSSSFSPELRPLTTLMLNGASSTHLVSSSSSIFSSSSSPSGNLEASVSSFAKCIQEEEEEAEEDAIELQEDQVGVNPFQEVGYVKFRPGLEEDYGEVISASYDNVSTTKKLFEKSNEKNQMKLIHLPLSLQHCRETVGGLSTQSPCDNFGLIDHNRIEVGSPPFSSSSSSVKGRDSKMARHSGTGSRSVTKADLLQLSSKGCEIGIVADKGSELKLSRKNKINGERNSEPAVDFLQNPGSKKRRRFRKPKDGSTRDFIDDIFQSCL